jgi:RNase P/RNase MRP subunit POP5
MTKISLTTPARRDHPRYIVFEIISDNTYDLGDVVKTIWYSILQLFGDVGTSDITFWTLSSLYRKSKKRGIIKTDNSSVDKIRSALSIIRTISSQNVIIKVIGVTGTIETAKTKFLDFE